MEQNNVLKQICIKWKKVEEVREELEFVLREWSPNCGYDSDEEKGYQKGLIAERTMLRKEILNLKSLSIKK